MQGDKGFPDLCLARNGVVIFAELKVGRNKLSPEQERWAREIGDVYLWKPEDLPLVARLLR